MRKILFRGKDKETGEWVEGYLYVRHDGVCEISCYNEDVNIERWTSNVTNESVGQYTGLNDKNGKQIFEGDILRHVDYPDEPMPLIWYVNGYALKGLWMDVEWPKILNKIEVIGNIHDNPELQKEAK